MSRSDAPRRGSDGCLPGVEGDATATSDICFGQVVDTVGDSPSNGRVGNHILSPPAGLRKYGVSFAGVSRPILAVMM